MANDFGSNPAVLDTASAAYAPLNGCKISGFIVNASADTWEVVLKNSVSGQIIFQMKSAIANHRCVAFSPAAPFWVSGIYTTTLTNITNVLVYKSIDNEK